MSPLKQAARPEGVPNAPRPELLFRLIEAIGQGVQSVRGLHEVLSVSQRTVRDYLHAARWLSLIGPPLEPTLSPLGLEIAFHPTGRPHSYARAVWQTPFVVRLMQRRPIALPPKEVLALAISAEQPALSPSTIDRRASALHSMLRPAFSEDALALDQQGTQLQLPLLTHDAPLSKAHAPPLSERFNLGTYSYLLGLLVDFGELGPRHLRTLLTGEAASPVQVDDYVQLALRRGDATRHHGQLILSVQGFKRRSWIDSPLRVALSDPDYRAHLQRRLQHSGGSHPWDAQLFGPAPSDRLHDTLKSHLGRRTLSDLPLCDATGEPVQAITGPFLSQWSSPQLPVCLPPTLLQLQGDLSGLNQLLFRYQRDPHREEMPSLVHWRARFHGGLFAPGEDIPPNVPDRRCLRLRLLTNAPYPSLITCLLILHRTHGALFSLIKSRGRWTVRLQDGRSIGGLLPLLDAFGSHQRWLVSRRPKGAKSVQRLINVLEQIGIATQTSFGALLSEHFFHQLRGEAEEMELFDLLSPLCDALYDWLRAHPKTRHP